MSVKIEPGVKEEEEEEDQDEPREVDQVRRELGEKVGAELGGRKEKARDRRDKKRALEETGKIVSLAQLHIEEASPHVRFSRLHRLLLKFRRRRNRRMLRRRLPRKSRKKWLSQEESPFPAFLLFPVPRYPITLALPSNLALGSFRAPLATSNSEEETLYHTPSTSSLVQPSLLGRRSTTTETLPISSSRIRRSRSFNHPRSFTIH